jgi:nicotinamidase-related amidase
MSLLSYPRDKSALVLVDVLNDFLADDGKLNSQVKPMVDKMDLKTNLKRLLDGTRAAGIQVVYAPHGLEETTFDDFKYLLPRMQWGKANQVFWKGSPGADFYEPLRPLEGEFIAKRHHIYNSFPNTDLDDYLRSKGIEKVVFAGLTSQTCVEGTGRYALELGYHVTFLRDGVAEFTEKAQAAAIELSYPAFGHEVLTISEFLEALKNPV